MNDEVVEILTQELLMQQAVLINELIVTAKIDPDLDDDVRTHILAFLLREKNKRFTVGQAAPV